MDQSIVYNVHHHDAMGGLIVIYFFLSGLGAGAFLTSAGLRFFGGAKYAKIEKTAAILAPLLLIPGLACLLLETGRPERFLNLFLYFNPASIASWGVWVINVFLVVSVIHAYFHVTGRAQKFPALFYAGFVFAIAVGLYSGMLLYQMHGYALWHSALVPAMFLASAVASGLAVVLLVPGSRSSELTGVLSNVFAVVIGVDLVLALTEILTLLWSSGEKAAAGDIILSGQFGLLFIGVYLIAGLAVPLTCLVRQRTNRSIQAFAAVLVLVGTLAMRYVIVMGGQALPLS